MTDTLKLKGAMASVGMSQRACAKRLGLSANALNNKVNNKTAFTTEEAVTLCTILGITDPRTKCEIFLHDTTR